MTNFTQSQYDAIHELPLRKDVEWLTLPELFPGMVIEKHKRPGGEEGEFKFGSIQLGDIQLAQTVCDCHNEWLRGNHADR